MGLGRALARLFRGRQSSTQQDAGLMGYLSASFGIHPKELAYYKVALTHRSNPLKMKGGDLVNNERLEFLGDAVLQLIVSDYLFRKYPLKQEGVLTRLRSNIVRRASFNSLGKSLGLEAILRQFISDPQFSPRIVGDALEALFGAIYLDLGYEEAKSVAEARILTQLIDFEGMMDHLLDAKTLLLQWGQQNHIPIEYNTESLHGKGYLCRVKVNGQERGQGTGRSKKEAEQRACDQVVRREGITLEGD